MRNLCKKGAGILLAVLCLSACSDSKSNYPGEYVGFEKMTATYTFSKTAEDQDISIKIIAAEKQDKDREVTLAGKWKPGEQPAFRLMDTKVIIPAKKKSATARIRFFPRQMKQNTEVRIICSPKDKNVEQTQLTLKLVVK